MKDKTPPLAQALHDFVEESARRNSYQLAIWNGVELRTFWVGPSLSKLYRHRIVLDRIVNTFKWVFMVSPESELMRVVATDQEIEGPYDVSLDIVDIMIMLEYEESLDCDLQTELDTIDCSTLLLAESVSTQPELN